MRRIVVLALALLILVAGPGAAAPSNAEANDGDDRKVILISGTPTSFVSFDTSGFPVLVVTIAGTTTEGPLTITETIGSFFDDLLFGSSPGGTDGEHILATGTWDFGGGDTLTTDTRVFISPILVTETCGEFVPPDLRAVITGGTGRFANAIGNIQTVIDPFCFDDIGPVPLTGSIDGLIVVPDDDDDDDDD